MGLVKKMEWLKWIRKYSAGKHIITVLLPPSCFVNRVGYFRLLRCGSRLARSDVRYLRRATYPAQSLSTREFYDSCLTVVSAGRLCLLSRHRLGKAFHITGDGAAKCDRCTRDRMRRSEFRRYDSGDIVV